MSMLGEIDVAAVAKRHPGLLETGGWRRFAPAFSLAALIVYLVYVWFFFSMPTVLAKADWAIAGNYLADWVSYESRPDVKFKPGYLKVSFPRYDPLGPDPHPDWLSTEKAVVSKTVAAPKSGVSAVKGPVAAGSPHVSALQGLTADQAAASAATPDGTGAIGAGGFMGKGGFMGSGGAMGTASAAGKGANADASPATRTIHTEEVVATTVRMGSAQIRITQTDRAQKRVVVNAYDTQLAFVITPNQRVSPQQPLPAWAIQKQDGGKVIVGLGFAGRVEIQNDKVKIRNRFLGWENFVFDTNSPFFGKSLAEVSRLVLYGPDLVPGTSNAALAWDNIWNNAEWQHGDVWTKLLQTIVMAFLGTLLAALVAFPLAFFAARNITPNFALNQGLKRFFDFTRSVDMLIWALFFTRAFGPGPLAGMAAIFFTDTGTFGKLFSEALENVDDKQREGLRSVGAPQLLVQRFGVIPQVLPVFVSQTLYFWESNTRSATIIGAVGAGGIGLKLWEAMRTNSDWENVGYMVVLILAVVFLFDHISSALRSRLIGTKN